MAGGQGDKHTKNFPSALAFSIRKENLLLPLDRLTAYLVSGRVRGAAGGSACRTLSRLWPGYHAEGKREKNAFNKKEPAAAGSLLLLRFHFHSTMMERSGIMVLPCACMHDD
ncbi:hypothetical protein UY416_24395 [Paenibacillus polymyxa]|uniref:hypothetical protein n=1 Tax=Paenibacillus polymyxa TaxID=1406 RepID=UPI002AB4371D|nr:hypothetical protein [Paenibacillus polymyxa]MDY8049437.1 hypothetical protein [Paenibacillus polymyxa]